MAPWDKSFIFKRGKLYEISSSIQFATPRSYFRCAVIGDIIDIVAALFADDRGKYRIAIFALILGRIYRVDFSVYAVSCVHIGIFEICIRVLVKRFIERKCLERCREVLRKEGCAPFSAHACDNVRRFI